MVAGELDRAQGEHPAAGGRHLEHLVEADTRLSLRAVGHDAGVGGEHAGDVGVDLAGVGLERGGQGDGGGVGAAPAEGGDLVRRCDTPWKPATTGTLPAASAVADPVALDLEDLGLAVDGVGDDADLAAGEADGLDAEVGERHAQQRHGLALAGGEQHVHLAAGLGARDLRWRGR